MAANWVYTQPVVDYFTSIPIKYEQKILETMLWGVMDGLDKDVIRQRCYLKGISMITDAVFDESYDAMVKECRGLKLEFNSKPIYQESAIQS